VRAPMQVAEPVKTLQGQGQGDQQPSEHWIERNCSTPKKRRQGT
jgi:hypothetical protein